jgi:putative ABC transport system permease protein
MFEALADPDVAWAEPLYVGKLDWRQPDGSMRNMDVFGLSPAMASVGSPLGHVPLKALMPIDTAIVDIRTRALDPTLTASLRTGEDYAFEAKGRRLDVVHTVDLGAGFTSDGYMIVADQTFFALFAERGPGTPNHILVKLKSGADATQVSQRLRTRLSSIDTQIRTFEAAIAHDIRYQTTQRPVGIIFGFGVVMGLIVGTVIVYQILSTDVADHLREYATFKAIGYERRFFLGIVFEQAAALSVLGFIPALLLALGLYAMMSDATGLPVAMSVARPPGVFLATLVMCGLSGALATRRLEKADPAELF